MSLNFGLVSVSIYQFLLPKAKYAEWGGQGQEELVSCEGIVVQMRVRGQSQDCGVSVSESMLVWLHSAYACAYVSINNFEIKLKWNGLTLKAKMSASWL